MSGERRSRAGVSGGGASHKPYGSPRSVPEDAYVYRILFETSTEGMLLAADGGEIFDANPEACRILQRTREELTEAGLDVLFDPSDPRLETAREGQRKTGKFEGELRLLRGDGPPFPAEVSIVRYRDENGKDISQYHFPGHHRAQAGGR